MNPPKRRRMNVYQKQADGILNDIATAKACLSITENQVIERMEAIRKVFAAENNAQNEHLALLEKELIALCKEHSKEIFKGSDKTDLPTGVLLHSKFKWVTRKKGVFEKIEAAGFERLLKIAKSVDWDEVDKLDDESLAEIGTGRVHKETFSYELKG